MPQKLARNIVAVALTGACLSGVSITGAAAASSPSTSGVATEATGDDDRDGQRTTSAAQPSAGVTRLSAANSTATEGVGDLLGLGFEQRVTLEGNTVHIRDLTEKGERPIESFKAIDVTEYKVTGIHPQPELNDAGLLRPQVAVGDKAIYVTEPWSTLVWSTKIHRYERVNGTWTQTASIAHRDHIVTAMAVGKVAGKEVVALGLNRSGVRVQDGKTLGEAASGYEFGTDWQHSHWFMFAKRGMVSALAVGDRGDGVEVIQVGRMTYDEHATIQYPANGARTINGGHWVSEFRPLTDPWYYPTAFAMGGGERTREKAQLAVGYNGVNVKIASATYGTEWAASGAGRTQWLRFFPDVEGQQTLAASTSDGGRAYRYTPGQATQLTPQVLGNQGATVVDLRAFLNWFPGSKTYDVRVENASTRSIDVQSLALNDQSRGCWLKSGLPNGTLTPGQSSTTSRTGYYTATIPGKDGGFCAETSEKNMYVNVTPTGQPGQGRLIARVGADSGALSISSNEQTDGQITDGELTATMVRNDTAGFSWTVKISDATSRPTIVSAPTMTGQRLTAERKTGAVVDPNNPLDPMYPVYRFDVQDIAWQVPASTTRSAVVLDAGKVEGITADGRATMLGYLKPATAPTLAEGTLTTGPASFFVQNTKDVTYTQVRVSMGGQSTTIDLGSLTAPAPVTDSTVSGIDVTGQQGEGANISAFANGLDQAPLTVGIRTSNNQHLPASDPRYSRIYYRTVSDNRLITGLVDPAQPAEGMSITSHQGMFANQGTSMNTSSGVVKNFLTTTTTSNRAIKAVLGDTGTVDPTTSGDLYVTPHTTVPTLQGAGYYGLTAPHPGGGSNLQLTAPTATRPVPYDTRNAATTAYQLKAIAMTGKGSLPLFTVGEKKGHLTHVPLEFANPTTAKVTAADFSYVGETFSAQIVSRGYLLTTEAPNHG